jgi:hypothetical protein
MEARSHTYCPSRIQNLDRTVYFEELSFAKDIDKLWINFAFFRETLSDDIVTSIAGIWLLMTSAVCSSSVLPLGIA